MYFCHRLITNVIKTIKVAFSVINQSLFVLAYLFVVQKTEQALTHENLKISAGFLATFLCYSLYYMFGRNLA